MSDFRLQRKRLADADVTDTASIEAGDRVPLERDGETIAWNPSSLTGVNVATTFDNVAAMVADDALSVGQYVSTRGHTNPGDHGGGLYQIVAAGTGTDDGGEYHDLTGITGQAQLLHYGSIYAEQFGAVDGVEASAEIQAAWDALFNWQAAQAANTHTYLFHKSRVTIQNQVEFKDPAGATTDFMHFDLSGASWTATTGGDLSTTTAILKVRATNANQTFGYLNGNKAVACLDLYGVTGSRAWFPECRNFKGYGIRVRGSAGSFVLYNPICTEYSQSDAEYPTRGNYSADGISVETGDWNCYNANVLFCNRCVYLGADAVQVHFVGAHLVNGNADYPTTAAWTDPILVENDATRENHFDDCYFDNGLIEDNTTTLHINGGHYVNNGAATLTEPKIRLNASSVGQTSAPDLRVTDLGGLASMGFIDTGGNTWSGDLSGLAGLYSGMSDENKTVQAVQTEYNLFANEGDDVQINYKIGGTFTYTWQIGSDAFTFDIDPTNDTAYFSGELGARWLKVRDWVTGFGGDELTISSGSITPNQDFHRVDTESDASSDDLDTIDDTNAHAGAWLTLCPASNARTVVIKNDTGNIKCGSDLTLDSLHDTATFRYYSGNWRLVSHSNNA